MSNDDGIREVPRDEWERMKQEREQARAETQTAGELWDRAREAWLRLDYRRRSPETRYNQSEQEWVDIGQKIGVSDAEVLAGGAPFLEQAKRELAPPLFNALAEVMPKPRRKGGKRGEPKLTKDRVMATVLALYKLHHYKPKAAEVAKALKVDRSNFRKGKPARAWLTEALDLLSSVK